MVSRKENKSGAVGKSILRFDGPEKVNGTAKYVDDLKIDDCWQAVVVRSHVSHGILKSIDFDQTFDWSKVVVVTETDIEGTNLFDMHDELMPVLATELKYKGEAYALVAAPDKALALEALEHIHPVIEELPAITTLDEIVEQFKSNSADMHILCDKTIDKGSLEQGFSDSDFIVEHEYRTGFQEQLYIEPNGLVSIPDGNGGVLITGSMQCPFYVVNEAHKAIGLTKEQLRVSQTTVGGAFGGKEEFPSVLGAYAALLSLKANKPVKLIFDREEDIQYSTKRHPSWIRHKTGLKKDGTITAIEVDYILDGGAYLTISDVVMYRGILHAAMGYKCDNVLVKGKTLRTNTFPNGAFRGFGAPQATWAFESHIDKLAAKCSMTPHEFRLKNCLTAGGITPTGQQLNETTGSKEVLEDALSRSAFSDKYETISKGKKLNENGKFYGIGLSFFAHGSAFTGDGEVKIGAKVALDIVKNPDTGNCVPRVLVSSTEMGQGALTVLRQAASHGLGVPVESVEHPFPDTSIVPDSGPTVASRTTMVVGSSLFRAGVDMRKMLISFMVDSDGGASDSRAGDGSAGDGSTDDGSTGDGSTDDGSAGDGSTDDGSAGDGSAGDGSTDDGGINVIDGEIYCPERDFAYPDDTSSVFAVIDGKSYTFNEIASKYIAQKGELKVLKGFELPSFVEWYQTTFKGHAYPDYAWGCAVVEVEVDPVTCSIEVSDVWSTWDIGTVINPMMAHGQIEGGLTQALGFAIMEKITMVNGLYDTKGMQSYVVPTALDIPKYHTNFLEFPYLDAEPGAKGIGEVPLDGLAPAIANAVAAATGLAISELPVVPEKLMKVVDDFEASITESSREVGNV